MSNLFIYSSRNSPPLTLTLDSKNNSKADDNLCDLDLVSRQMLMIQRGRAFTFPDIPPRARTVSETAEEIDQVSCFHLFYFIFCPFLTHCVWNLQSPLAELVMDRNVTPT